jgi:hypothetical protein
MVLHEYPLGMVDHVDFRSFARALQALFPDWDPEAH